jgi:hypothetical protein
MQPDLHPEAMWAFSHLIDENKKRRSRRGRRGKRGGRNRNKRRDIIFPDDADGGPRLGNVSGGGDGIGGVVDDDSSCSGSSDDDAESSDDSERDEDAVLHQSEGNPMEEKQLEEKQLEHNKSPTTPEKSTTRHADPEVPQCPMQDENQSEIVESAVTSQPADHHNTLAETPEKQHHHTAVFVEEDE